MKSELKLYAVAYFAKNRYRVDFFSGTVKAHSLDSARELAMKSLKESHPASEYWHNWLLSVVEVPITMQADGDSELTWYAFANYAARGSRFEFFAGLA